MKCSVCNEKIAKTFLDKIEGTYVKKKPVCKRCQQKLSITEIKEKL